MKTSWPSRIRATAQSRGFRAFLGAHYEARRSRNRNYSLRAFARDLGLDHSTLSQILRGRRALTSATIVRIGERLGLGEEIIRSYLDAGSGERPPSRADLEALQLSLDAFEVIADWHHFALLELTRVEGFRPDSRWIARTLGITTDAVNIAVSRLVRLGLLRMSDHGFWEDCSGNVAATHAGLSDAALARIHRDAHQLAIHAIDNVPAALRDQASITLALDTARLPEVAALMAKFRRDLEELAARDETRDDVYRVEISLFPLTTLHQQKENRHG